MLKQVKIYSLGYLITYLIIRYKAYISGHKRKIFEEFNSIDIKANHYIFIEQRKIIGLARIWYRNGQIAEIGRVTIAREYKNQGYGRKMMKQVINIIEDSNKAKLMNLFVVNNNLIKFYQSFGFVESGEGFFGDIPYVSMTKIIEQKKGNKYEL